MALLDLPRTWGGKLVTAIRAINEQVEDLAEGGGGGGDLSDIEARLSRIEPIDAVEVNCTVDENDDLKIFVDAVRVSGLGRIIGGDVRVVDLSDDSVFYTSSDENNSWSDYNPALFQSFVEEVPPGDYRVEVRVQNEYHVWGEWATEDVTMPIPYLPNLENVVLTYIESTLWLQSFDMPDGWAYEDVNRINFFRVPGDQLRVVNQDPENPAWENLPYNFQNDFGGVSQARVEWFREDTIPNATNPATPLIVDITP